MITNMDVKQHCFLSMKLQFGESSLEAAEIRVEDNMNPLTEFISPHSDNACPVADVWHECLLRRAPME